MARELGDDEAEVVELVRRVLYIHDEIIREFGGHGGIRDYGALESAVASAWATFSGELLHFDVFDRAAALLRSLILNHPFVDGNKRTAWVAAREYLLEHGYTRRRDVSQQAIEEFALRVAAGELDVSEIAQWLRQHMQPVRNGDRRE